MLGLLLFVSIVAREHAFSDTTLTHAVYADLASVQAYFNSDSPPGVMFSEEGFTESTVKTAQRVAAMYVLHDANGGTLHVNGQLDAEDPSRLVLHAPVHDREFVRYELVRPVRVISVAESKSGRPDAAPWFALDVPVKVMMRPEDRAFVPACSAASITTVVSCQQWSRVPYTPEMLSPQRETVGTAHICRGTADDEIMFAAGHPVPENARQADPVDPGMHFSCAFFLPVGAHTATVETLLHRVRRFDSVHARHANPDLSLPPNPVHLGQPPVRTAMHVRSESLRPASVAGETTSAPKKEKKGMFERLFHRRSSRAQGGNDRPKHRKPAKNEYALSDVKFPAEIIRVPGPVFHRGQAMNPDPAKRLVAVDINALRARAAEFGLASHRLEWEQKS